MQKLKHKYGFWTASAMIVGIVVGVGIFIKSSQVLSKTGGNLVIALLAWLIGGIIMIFNAYTFSLVGSSHENINGLSDYLDLTSNKKVSYYVSFYMATVYLPVITSVVGYFTSGYLMTVFNISDNGLLQLLITILLLFILFFFNVVAPKIAAYFQITTTFIKLLPIIAIVLIGLCFRNNQPVGLITTPVTNVTNNFFSALLITCFAYEGWIMSTTISKEVKNSKKNLPKALLFGAITVVVVYILYILGLSLSLSVEGVLMHGAQAPVAAFEKLFGSFSGKFMNIVFFISCLGGLNGLVMGSSRSFYQLADKNYTPNLNRFGKLNKKYNTSFQSAILSLVITSLYVCFAYLTFNKGIFNGNYDSIAIAILYIPYLYIYIYVIKHMHSLNVFNRVIAPVLALLGGLFFIFSAVYEIVNGFIHKETLPEKIPVILVLTILSLLIAKAIKAKRTND